MFLMLCVVYLVAAVHTQCVQCMSGAVLRQWELCRFSNDWLCFQNHLMNSTVLTWCIRCGVPQRESRQQFVTLTISCSCHSNPVMTSCPQTISKNSKAHGKKNVIGLMLNAHLSKFFVCFLMFKLSFSKLTFRAGFFSSTFIFFWHYKEHVIAHYLDFRPNRIELVLC